MKSFQNAGEEIFQTVKSMTAFGRYRATLSGRDFTAEIRSVNSRYLDCSVRMPRRYAYLEEKIKPYLQEKGIVRGNVDVTLSAEGNDAGETKITLDEKQAAEYLAALYRLRDQFGLPDDITTMRVAQNRDLFTATRPAEDADRDWADLRAVLDGALSVFLEAREREGRRLADDLSEKLTGIEAKVAEIEALSEEHIRTYREKFEARLRQIIADTSVVLDNNRVLTECAVFADRVAIDEELVRLRSHFVTFREYLASPDAVGRSMDFLLQEINREINTIGSKCLHSAIAKIVVDVKTELEKIREQLQNLE